jgi:hypothetical protein
VNRFRVRIPPVKILQTCSRVLGRNVLGHLDLDPDKKRQVVKTTVGSRGIVKTRIRGRA